MKRDLLELKQKLMTRFLDGAIDQATYDTMLADINAMAEAEAALDSPVYPPATYTGGEVQMVPAPVFPTDYLHQGGYFTHQEMVSAEGHIHAQGGWNPEIDPKVIASLKPGDALELWWHHEVTEACVDAWRGAGVPLRISLTLNESVDDETVRRLSNVRNIRDLNLTSTPVTDEGIRHLGALSGLETLILTSTAVEGKTFHYLAECRKLREITLTSTPFGDEGMESLNALQSLELLRLDDSDITDEGLLTLTGLHQLQILNLQGTLVSDAGLDAVAAMTTLLELYIGGTIPYEGLVYESPISDAGVRKLQELVELRILHLNDTQVTDAAVGYLKKMERLCELNVADTFLTDGALPALKKLADLREIMVENTAITLSGIRKVFGPDNADRVHGGRVGAWNKLGRFLASPWSRKN